MAKEQVNDFMRQLKARANRVLSEEDVAKLDLTEDTLRANLFEIHRLMQSPLWLYRLENAVQSLVRTACSPVERPPGSTLRSLAEFVCSKKAFQRVYKPLLDDAEFEYIEALAQGKIAKARLIRWTCVVNFWSTAVVYVSTSLLVKAVGIIRLIAGG
jgi:hypothetical protein